MGEWVSEWYWVHEWCMSKSVKFSGCMSKWVSKWASKVVCISKLLQQIRNFLFRSKCIKEQICSWDSCKWSRNGLSTGIRPIPAMIAVQPIQRLQRSTGVRRSMQCSCPMINLEPWQFVGSVFTCSLCCDGIGLQLRSQSLCWDEMRIEYSRSL